MKKYHRKTLIPRPNIDVQLLWNNIDPTDKNDTKPRWKAYTATDFTSVWEPEVHKKLNTLGFFIKSIRVFRWMPEKVFEWHVDGTANQVEHFAVNWVVEGQGIVQWNSEIALNTLATHGFSRGVKAGSITDYIEEQTDGDQCILDISMPHRVVNLSNEHRMTISVTFKNNLTYSDAVSILDANNLLVD